MSANVSRTQHTSTTGGLEHDEQDGYENDYDPQVQGAALLGEGAPKITDGADAVHVDVHVPHDLRRSPRDLKHRHVQEAALLYGLEARVVNDTVYGVQHPRLHVHEIAVHLLPVFPTALDDVHEVVVLARLGSVIPVGRQYCGSGGRSEICHDDRIESRLLLNHFLYLLLTYFLVDRRIIVHATLTRGLPYVYFYCVNQTNASRVSWRWT